MKTMPEDQIGLPATERAVEIDVATSLGGKTIDGTTPEKVEMERPKVEMYKFGEFEVAKPVVDTIKQAAFAEYSRKKERELKESGKLKTDEEIQMIEAYKNMLKSQQEKENSKYSLDKWPDEFKQLFEHRTKMAIEPLQEALNKEKMMREETQKKYDDTMNRLKSKHAEDKITSILRQNRVRESMIDLCKAHYTNMVEVDDDLQTIRVRENYSKPKFDKDYKALEYTLEDLINETISDDWKETASKAGAGGQYNTSGSSSQKSDPLGAFFGKPKSLITIK